MSVHQDGVHALPEGALQRHPARVQPGPQLWKALRRKRKSPGLRGFRLFIPAINASAAKTGTPPAI